MLPTRQWEAISRLLTVASVAPWKRGTRQTAADPAGAETVKSTGPAEARTEDVVTPLPAESPHVVSSQAQISYEPALPLNWYEFENWPVLTAFPESRESAREPTTCASAP